MTQELPTREFRYSIAVQIKGCDTFCVLLTTNEAQRLIEIAEVRHEKRALHRHR
jgi:hypothetical protein